MSGLGKRQPRQGAGCRSVWFSDAEVVLNSGLTYPTYAIRMYLHSEDSHTRQFTDAKEMDPASSKIYRLGTLDHAQGRFMPIILLQSLLMVEVCSVYSIFLSF